MAHPATPRVHELIERLSELPPENQDSYAAAFLSQIDSDDDFDRLIASRPDVLRQMADDALAASRGGKTGPLTERDFDLAKD